MPAMPISCHLSGAKPLAALAVAAVLLVSGDAADAQDATVDAQPATATITEETAPDETAVTTGQCAGAFHAALQQIDADRVKPLRSLLKSTRTGWRKLTGRWMFPPGRIRSDAPFGRVVRRAGRMVRYRGGEAGLSQIIKTHDVARATLDLRRYIGQKPGPALCAGAPQYMDFIAQHLESLRTAHERAANGFEEAAQQADWKFLDAKAALAEPLEAEDDETRAEFRKTVVKLRRVLYRARSAWSAILERDDETGHLLDHVSELGDLRDTLRDVKLSRRHPLQKRRHAVHVALTAVEAMVYVQASLAKHVEVIEAFDGTIGAVRAAHTENCICSAEGNAQ